MLAACGCAWVRATPGGGLQSLPRPQLAGACPFEMRGISKGQAQPTEGLSMDYEQTADAIARNIWEISTGNGAKLDPDLWDSHRQKCNAATVNTYVEGISVDDWQTAALARIEGGHMPRPIDETPTWAGLMPALIAVIENGTDQGRENAVAELMRLAAAADTYIVTDKARAAERGTKYQAIIWTKDREGNPLTILLTEGAAQDVAAYLMPDHHPATAEIAEHGAKISEGAARAYGGSWPAHLTYRR